VVSGGLLVQTWIRTSCLGLMLLGAVDRRGVFVGGMREVISAMCGPLRWLLWVAEYSGMCAFGLRCLVAGFVEEKRCRVREYEVLRR
jgi:hypothetical protein